MPSKKKFLGAVVQIGQYSSKEGSLEKIENLLEECAKCNAELVCLQPYALTGYASRESAETIPGPSTERLADKCKDLSLYLVAGSMVEKHNTSYYSTIPFISPDGKVIAKYRSIKLANYGPKGELDAGLTAGEEICVVDTELGQLGLTQGGIPALLGAVFRIKDCQAVISLEGCLAQDNDAFRFGARFSAYYGNFYVLATNPWGIVKSALGEGFLYLGSSRIVSPRGEVLANAGEYGEGFAIAPIDLELASKLQDRSREKRQGSKIFKISLDLLEEFQHSELEGG